MLKLKDILKWIYNALKVDYIVEEGTSGIWTYRKWNSGIAECWGRYDWAATINNQWGSLYTTPVNTFTIPLPFNFKSPVNYINHNTTANNYLILGSVHGWSNGSSVYITLINVGIMNNITGGTWIEVKGRWK